MDENEEKQISFKFLRKLNLKLLGTKSAICQNNPSLLNYDGNSSRHWKNILAANGEQFGTMEDNLFIVEKKVLFQCWTS